MPKQRVVEVFHYEDGRCWIAPEIREYPTYDEEVALRTQQLRTESGTPIHDPGECVECDALRLRDS